jgi:uncharacterized protein (TIGR02217 family)
MNLWFTSPGATIDMDFVKRFDPLYWTVDFPRGAMASAVTSDDGHGLEVNACFLREGDLAGLIWTSADGGAHPAHARETSRDYSGCVLTFRWQSEGLVPLDALNGPTLTIEGRDGSGSPRAWYVRLWNYAQGTGEDALVRLDFDALDGGFLLPGEADRVDPRDIDRMFVSLVPPGYVAGSAAFLAAPAEGQATISDIACDGPGSVISAGDAMAPEHELRIATAYDDQYHWTPQRVVQAIHRLGYRKLINHYVGMSHYFALGPDGLLDPARTMNAAALAWHRGFARAAGAWGYDVIWSLSFEILDQFCPDEWKQRSFDGAPGLTGYDPPSALVSPAIGAGVDYLGRIAAALVGIADEAGIEPNFQVGEPWWWVTADHRPCFYDAAAKALLGGDPPEIADVRGPKDADEIDLLDSAGALLASATQAVAAAAKAAVPATRSHLLAYLPGPLDPAAPEMRRANLPLGWARPAFDVLQLEDYEWVTGRRDTLRRTARAAALARLGYPLDETHYLSGFAAQESAAADWPAIIAAAEEARSDGAGEAIIWALPQVLRDGLTIFGKDDEMVAFEDVEFPLAIGNGASVAPGFSTEVVTSASGHEQRNANWSQARLRFDAGPGVRGEAELGELIAFFRARRGPATAFRFRDPYDHSSSAMAGTPGAGDQPLGSGDGTRTGFALVKTYGEGGEQRRITRPVAGSVRVAVDGEEQLAGWALEAGGIVRFDAAPAVGAAVSAGFLFDVPVRFASDEIEVNRETFLAGEAPSVPLVEVREG